MWYYYSDYFSTQLIISDVSTFSTNSSYIFGYHPHGILALGAFSSFLTNYCNIQQILDGFNIRLATIPLNFYLPFYREIFQLMGFISCSKTSILNSLNLNNSQGNIVVLPIGGAREALFARPGKMDLILKNRLGFIKLALITG
ncbi:diacylglycerol acyltransferase [Neoconidiobolus thromboides FSU 785]|nr:diacylglycerol acyltransferase [Neoconidiobolus thromboides FSU 785]